MAHLNGWAVVTVRVLHTDTGTLLLSATVKGYGVSRSESTRRTSGNLGWTKRYPGYILSEIYNDVKKIYVFLLEGIF